jgi:hypothetical protein
VSVAAAQADAFYEEHLTSGLVYTVRDDGGIPAPMNGSGVRVMPFWSKRSRAEQVIANVAAFAGMSVVELSGDEWNDNWLPGLENDGLLVGLNWSGKHATGYDLSVADLTNNLAARRTLRGM